MFQDLRCGFQVSGRDLRDEVIVHGASGVERGLGFRGLWFRLTISVPQEGVQGSGVQADYFRTRLVRDSKGRVSGQGILRTKFTAELNHTSSKRWRTRVSS